MNEFDKTLKQIMIFFFLKTGPLTFLVVPHESTVKVKNAKRSSPCTDLQDWSFRVNHFGSREGTDSTLTATAVTVPLGWHAVRRQ